MASVFTLMGRTFDTGIAVAETGLDTINEVRDPLKKTAKATVDVMYEGLRLFQEATLKARTGEDDLEKAIIKAKRQNKLLDSYFNEESEDDLQVIPDVK